MGRNNKNYDDGTYVSESSIDSPPRHEEEEKEPKQASLFPDVPQE